MQFHLDGPWPISRKMATFGAKSQRWCDGAPKMAILEQASWPERVRDLGNRVLRACGGVPLAWPAEHGSWPYGPVGHDSWPAVTDLAI